MNPDHFNEVVPRLSAGAPRIDALLGGGWPRGRIVELFGKANSGKRTLALTALADKDRQTPGYAGVWIELRDDGQFDAVYANRCGWAEQSVVYLAAPTGRRNVCEYVERVVRKGSHALVVVSGLQVLQSGDELLTRIVSQGMRRLVNAAHATRTCVMFLRDEQGCRDQMFPASEGPASNALRFYATMRVHAQATPWHDGGCAGVVGQLHVVKNKLNPPFTRCGFVVQHSHGLVAEEIVGAVQAAPR